MVYYYVLKDKEYKMMKCFTTALLHEFNSASVSPASRISKEMNVHYLHCKLNGYED
jgi:hypothetical protein